MEEAYKIRVGITQGDINGIGYEVIIKTLADLRVNEFCVPIVYGSSKAAAYHRKMLNIENFNLNVINTPEEANQKRSNIINCGDENIKVELAKSTEEAGKAAYLALERAASDLKAGLIDVLVTAPINKKNIQSQEFHFPGHAEFLQDRFSTNGERGLSMLVSDVLRVAVVTGHVPLRQVASYITQDSILNKLSDLNHVLKQDFAVQRPRIAVLGLNPHAGDGNVMGEEEEEIIIPALKKATEQGITCFGPYPADSFFGSGSFKNFDAVLAMYHDQGQVAFKCIAMECGVNYTANLPIIRTSPVHGTAYDLVGVGEASEESFRNALYLACDVWKCRKQYEELTKNRLKKQDVEISGQVD